MKAVGFKKFCGIIGLLVVRNLTWIRVICQRSQELSAKGQNVPVVQNGRPTIKLDRARRTTSKSDFAHY